jgi:hypothetical protein
MAQAQRTSTELAWMACSIVPADDKGAPEPALGKAQVLRPGARMDPKLLLLAVRVMKSFISTRAHSSQRNRRLPGDVLAGLTVSCLLIPQSISYASSLAKLSPVVGLVRFSFLSYFFPSSCIAVLRRGPRRGLRPLRHLAPAQRRARGFALPPCRPGRRLRAPRRRAPARAGPGRPRARRALRLDAHHAPGASDLNKDSE